MKTRGILFTGAMVNALLAGKKTQTRRLIKPQPEWKSGWYWRSPRYDNGDGADYFHTEEITPPLLKCWAKANPYGMPGDQLWVRETWTRERDGRVVWAADRAASYTGPNKRLRGGLFWLESNYEPTRWKPSIHMPRIYSRILLGITTARVERIKDIQHADAVAEGFASVADFLDTFYNINKRAPSNANPWVWVIEFKAVAL